MTQRSHSEFSSVFVGIGCYGVTFKLRVKEGSYSYQAPPRIVIYALQQPLKKELDRLQKQQITVPFDVNEHQSGATVSSWYPRPVAKCNYAWILQGLTRY